MSLSIHTIELIERCRDGFDACLAAERDGESSFERRNHDRRMRVEVFIRKSIGVCLSRVVAMFMIGMVGWFVMRASQRASQPDPCSPPSLLRRWLGSLANEQSRQRNPLPLASTDITTTTTQPQQHHCSTAIFTTNTTHPQFLLPNNLCALEGDRPPPPCRNSLDRYIHTTTHHPLQTTLSNMTRLTRPASPTPAHGTTSTPAPTPAPSAASPPPSPSHSWASTNRSMTPVPTAATMSSAPGSPSCTPPARRCRRRSTTRTPRGPVA
jgi:hypothetical protein